MGYQPRSRAHRRLRVLKQWIMGRDRLISTTGRLLTAVTLPLLLVGCANQITTPSVTSPLASTAEAASIEPNGVPAVRSKAPLDGQSFFNILAAEMALAADNTELALAMYLKLLDDQPDSGVAQRVVYLAEGIGDYPDMANAAEIWLAAEPNNPMVHLALATSLYQMSHFELVDEPLLTLLRLDPDFPVETLFDPVQPRGSDPLALEALFIRLLAGEPNNAGLHLVYGQWLLEMKRLEEAKNTLHTSIKIQNSIGAQTLLARTEMQLSGPKAAATATKKALKQFPNNRRLVVQYARYLSMARLPEQALPTLESYHRLQPDDHPVLSLYARMALEAGETESARRLYENLLKFQPAMNEATFFLGTIAFDDGRFDSAVSYFRQVKPSDYFEPALSGLISTLAREFDTESALNELLALRQRYPEETIIYREHARLLSGLGDFTGALAALDAGLLVDERSTSLRYARAITLDTMQQKAAALVEFEAIIAQDPDHVLALNALGYTLANNNQDLDRAWDLIQRAYTIDSSDPAIIDSLGWIHYRLGDYDAAITHLSAAFEQTNNHEIAAHLGEVLWVTGQRDAAEAVWLKGLEHSPGSDIILDTRSRLLGQ